MQKIKLQLNRIWKLIKKFFINIKNVFKDNPLVLCYIIGSIVIGMILRAFTVGKVFSLAPLFGDIFMALFTAGLSFFISKKRRNIYLYIMCFLSTLVCLANIVYYSYYDSFISITFFTFVFTNYDTGGTPVLGGLLKPYYFIVLLFPLVMILLDCYLNKKEKDAKNDGVKVEKKSTLRRNRSSIFILALVSFGVLVLNLKGIDYARFNNQWNREYIVSRFGVYLYQLNDVAKSIEPHMISLFGSDKANKEINDYYANVPDKQNYKNKYTNIFKGKNVIAIHAESIQRAVMGLKFNGKEVAPVLNKLSREGLYFSNFYSQAGFGTSSDTEFTLATSILPITNGTVFINYSDRTYQSAYKIMQDMGYYTFSMHANTGDFWNRNVMHKSLGYQKFYEKSSYELIPSEKIGFGLSDKSFFLQSVDYIDEINKEHDNFFGTLITLSNHTPFAEVDKYGPFDVTMTVDGVSYPYMEGTKLGNYFKSVHYADEQLGLLISELDKRGILDNTIIMIYGDHDAKLSKKDWDRFCNYDYMTNDIKDENDPDYVTIDNYWYELNRSVPFIIWSKDKDFQENYSKEVKTVMGMYDVMPTLGNMLGFYNKYALGSDIMQMKNDNLVVLPSGDFITNYVYYKKSKEEYKALTDAPLDVDYIDKMKEKAEEKEKISDDIIIYDYFKKVLSSKKYEVER